MHKSSSKRGAVAFKLDSKKACDRVGWSFLQATLQGFDFPQIIFELIMHCVKSSHLSILWNGSKLESL